MRISDWSSDVCSSDLKLDILGKTGRGKRLARGAAAEDGRNLVLQLAVGSTCRARLRRRPPLQSLDDGAGAEQVLDGRPQVAARPMLAGGNDGDALADRLGGRILRRSEEHTSELQSLMRISYAVFCLKKKK